MTSDDDAKVNGRGAFSSAPAAGAIVFFAELQGLSAAFDQ
jgi:hypothetical protein